MVNFYERGEEVALGYRLGDKLLGAWGEADRLKINRPEWRAWFVEGYLAKLPRPIDVDKDGVIVRIEGVSKK